MSLTWCPVEMTSMPVSDERLVHYTIHLCECRDIRGRSTPVETCRTECDAQRGATRQVAASVRVVRTGQEWRMDLGGRIRQRLS